MQLALTGALITVAVVFWPANLGGHTTFVSTHGTSMLPRFHSGDLAIVQPASGYHVGDIAAYHSATLHTIVLHRIVAMHDGRFTFKGDNNNFTDPDHPTAKLLVGRLVARVPHGGAVRAMLARPVVLFPLLAFVFGGFAFGNQRSRRKRAQRRARPRPRHPRSAAPRLGRPAIAVLVVGALATSGAVLVAVTVWQTPRTEATTVAQPYRQTATIGYSGPAPRGAVYPQGQVQTGDPLFTRLIDRVTVDLHFTFAMSPSTRRAVRETSQVVADVSSDTGWQRELVLAPPHRFVGDQLHTTAMLDLRALQRIEHAFTAETGLSTPDVTLQIAWRLHVGGDAAATRLDADLVPVFAFQVTPVELLPTPAAGGGLAAGGASVSKTGSVPVPAERARTFIVGPVQLSDPLARLVAVVLIAVIVMTAAVVLAVDRRRGGQGAAAATIARYRYLLVDADAIPLSGRRPIVEVDRMRDLVRLAKVHEELIVHAEQARTRHRFALFTDAVVYVHGIGPVAATDTNIDDLATWALAGLQACVAERRHAPSTRRGCGSPTPTHPEAQIPDDISSPR